MSATIQPRQTALKPPQHKSTETRLGRSTLCVGFLTLKAALAVLGLMSIIMSARAASNLLENSPFLPADVAAHASPSTAPLELRSILEEGGQYEFSLYDPDRKQSTWVRLNEPGNPFLVKSFEPATNVVTVEHHNRTYTLALKEGEAAPFVAPSSRLVATPAQQSPGTESVPELEAIRQSGANEESILQELVRFRHRQILASQHNGPAQQAATPPSPVSP